MRRFCGLATLSTLCAFSLWSNTDAESRVSLLECKMKAARDEMVYDCRAGARYASGRPFLDSYGLWAMGDVLYWTAYEGGTDICYPAYFPTGGPEVPYSMSSLTFDWDVGYRIGLGWVAPHDNMEFSLLFTRIEPNGSFSRAVERTVQSPKDLNAVAIPGISKATHSEADWNIKYSVIDFELSRSYFVSRYFYMRPYFGSRTAWVMQSAYSEFSGFAMETARNPVRNDFVGSGLRIGSDSKWFFARHWNFFVGASVSTLFGKFTVASRPDQDSTYTSDIASSNYRIVPMAQTQIGLGWETNFSCDSNQIAINLGYELNYLWRQNQLPVFQNLARPVYGAKQSGDLGFHGMTVDFQLSF